MADDTKLKPYPLPSISRLAPTLAPVNPLKRKEPPVSSENEQKRFSPALPPVQAGVSDAQKNEYDKTCITCEVCRTEVGVLDEGTGSFTLKHCEAHRLTRSTSGQSWSDPVIYTLESTQAVETLAHPPTKHRCTKQTEEERIDYLRADPYVAQFEAHRVLCTSCNKWIRLRPHPTYCSIPWDAHRKSCLAKKINSKNVYAVEKRKALFSQYPDIRKLDAKRVLCSICDMWLSVNPDNHRRAFQEWLQHRAACQKNSTCTLPLNQLISPEPVSVVIGSGHGPTSSRGVQPQPPHSASPISPKPEPSFEPNNNTQPSFHV